MNAPYATTWHEARPAVTPGPGLRSAVRHIAISTLASLNRAWREPSLVCLYCHHVFDDQRGAFARIVDQLQQRGRFVDTDMCLRLLEGKEPLAGICFHLSFDDGLSNVHENAFPILQQRGIRPALFVPTAMIDADRSAERAFSLDVLGYRQSVKLVSRAQLVDLANAGWTIGSHTRTHRRLTGIHGRDLEAEVRDSKLELENLLGRECRYFSWPYGALSDVNEHVMRSIEATGYAASFGAFRGSVEPGQTDRWRIPRHKFEPDWPLAHVEFFARGNGASPRPRGGKTRD